MLRQLEIGDVPVVNHDASAHVFTRLSVEGYRGFQHAQTLNLARPNGQPGSGLTIIVGANSSGKSTVVEAMHYFSMAIAGSPISFPTFSRNSILDSVTLTLESERYGTLEVCSSTRGASITDVSIPNVWSGATGAPEVLVTPSRRSFSPLFPDMGMSASNWYQYSNGPARGAQRDEFTGRLTAIAQDPKMRAEFNQILERVVGRPTEWTIDEISLGQRYLKLRVGEQGFHNSEGMGEGLLSLFFIVVALLDSTPGSVVAIDEPELSLHPQLVRRLQKVFSDFGKDRQIIIATHSPLLLDWADIDNGASVARVHKSENMSKISQANPHSLKAVAKNSGMRDLNQPHTLGSEAKESFFFEDHILLLEGQEDVVYLPRALESLELRQIPNIFGWGSGGAEKMPPLAALLAELGFEKIAALLDGDHNQGTLDALKTLNDIGPQVLAVAHPAPDIRSKKAKVLADGNQRPEIVGLLAKDGKTVLHQFENGFRETMSQIYEFLDFP